MNVEALTLRLRRPQFDLLMKYFDGLRQGWEDIGGGSDVASDGRILVPVDPYAMQNEDLWDWCLVQLRMHEARHGAEALTTPMAQARDLDTFSALDLEALLRTLNMFDAPLLFNAVIEPATRLFEALPIVITPGMGTRLTVDVFASKSSLAEMISYRQTRDILRRALGSERYGALPVRKPTFVGKEWPKKEFDAAFFGAYPVDGVTASSGAGFTLVLADDGLYAFGINDKGQLGLGDNDTRVQPTKVPFVTSRLIQVACGRAHALVLDAMGNVLGCGNGHHGQLGGMNASSINVTLMTRVPLPEGRRAWRIACGLNHTVISTDQGLFVMGYNANGQLGLGDWDNRHAPTPLLTPGALLWCVCGPQQTFVLTLDGLYACGLNTGVLLGVGNRQAVHTTLQRVQVVDAKRVKKVCCSERHTVILTHEGFVYACGDVPVIDRRTQSVTYANYDVPTLLSALAPTEDVWVGNNGITAIRTKQGPIDILGAPSDFIVRMAATITNPREVLSMAFNVDAADQIGVFCTLCMRTMVTVYGDHNDQGQLGSPFVTPGLFSLVQVTMGTVYKATNQQQQQQQQGGPRPPKKIKFPGVSSGIRSALACRWCDEEEAKFKVELAVPRYRFLFCGAECHEEFRRHCLLPHCNINNNKPV